MLITKDMYVPILKWRMGEYQALMRLKSEVKDYIVPLIVVPPIEYDFEEERPKKTIDEHMSPFGKRYREKWGNRKCLIDLDDSLDNQIMSSGKHAIQHIFDEIRGESNAIPVVRFTNGTNHKKIACEIVKRDGKGAAFRVRLEELMDIKFNQRANALLKELCLEKSSIDLIIDLAVPETFKPYKEFADALEAILGSIQDLDSYRSFVIAGTSLYLGKVKKPGANLSRQEWKLYKEIYSTFDGSLRMPSFSDYTIEQPGFTDLGIRRIMPAGKIIYTVDEIWHIRKGGAFRDDNSQMKKHCEGIVQSEYFRGAKFSKGDLRIEKTANGSENYGNLTTWKWVGVNHHIATVVEQLSNFYGT